jgi:hypothetical protein
MSTLDRFKSINILVGLPSHGDWTAEFGMSLQNAMGYVMAKQIGQFRNQTIIPFHTAGSLLPRGRLKCVKAAQEKKATHLFFADVDQTFPRDTISRLILADKDIIGCNIATKQIPASPTARRKDGTSYGSLVYTDPDSPPYEKVWRLGCGIMLVKMKVWEILGLNTWEVLWKDELQDYQGEDWRFCELAEAAGIDIWVDHKLSDEIGHIGRFRYTHNEVGEIRQEVVNG